VAAEQTVPPASWSADVVLGDGGTVHIRPIEPEDADRILALHARLSERTRYLRFFGAYPRIPARDLDRFVNVDHVNRVALVATLGDDIVGVARFDRLPGAGDGDDDGDDGDEIAEIAEAEVAFLVEDAHQGRGLGSALLEHLAAAGRDRGVDRFVAEVLPENRQMMRVFVDAGYQVSHAFDEGVVHLVFPTAETERSVAVMHRREQATEARSVHRLLHPTTVVVVGAGAGTGLGRLILDNLAASGFTGQLSAVNRTGGAVGTTPGYRRVGEVPGPVDLAVVAVPAGQVPTVVADCARHGVPGVVVVSSGFAETGPAGEQAQQRLVQLARGHGMRVVGPNALGLVNTDPAVRLNATFAPVLPGPGRVGFFCQSGALGVALLASIAERQLGLSTFVSAGNRADVSGNDLLQYWEDDPATEVVLLYLESFGNPRKFARLARRLARRKPVIAVKTGRAKPGLAGAAALPDEHVRALFEAAGVVRVETVDELLDVAILLAHQPLPEGGRVAVVTNSTALGLLAADALPSSGLTLSARGVVDVGPQAPADTFERAVRDAIADPDVQAVAAVFVPPMTVPGPRVAEVLAQAAASGGKPVVSTFYATAGVPEALRRVGPDGGTARGSVPSYPSPEAAIRALGRAAGYARWRRRAPGAVPDLAGVDRRAAQATVQRLLSASGRGAPAGGPLGVAEWADLLATVGVPLVPAVPVATAEQAVAAAARLGYPVAVKSTDEALRHRVDLGGVRLDLAGPDQVRAAVTALASASRPAPTVAVVQQMVPPGVPVALGVQEDPSFGAIVTLGVAGIATELLDDRAVRAVPLTDVDAADLVRAPRAAPLLFGHRGAQPVDVGALEDLLLRVSILADAAPELVELQLNPVVVASRGVHVLDARGRLAEPGPRPDSGPRRMR